jgi:hypothetical protein
MDYDGNICGTDFGDKNMTDYSRLVYINSFGGGVCVKECPSIEELVDVHTLITYDGVYQEAGSFLPADYVEVADYSDSENVRTCDNTLCNTDPLVSWSRPGILGGKSFAYYAVDTFEVLGVRCISNPNALQKLKETVDTGTDALDIEAWSSFRQFFTNLYGDVFDARYYIVSFGIFAAMVSIFSILIMKIGLALNMFAHPFCNPRRSSVLFMLNFSVSTKICVLIYC